MSQPPLPALPPRYRDVTYLAAGAFGHVYRAACEQGPCAVKVLSPDWLGDAEAVWRFAGEYRRLAALAHPALPAALEEGLTEDGRPFFAMAFMEGRTLEELAPLPVEDARSTLARVAEALGYLHGRGLVHGDLKSANVLVHEGAIALLDVGSALATHQRRESVAGTPEYMAPEVLAQADAAPAADWYALGTLGYELLTGRTPFVSGAAGAAGVVRAQLFEAPPALTDAPADLAQAIASLLLKDPAARLSALPAAFAALGLPAPASEGLREGWLPRPEAEAAWEALSASEGADAIALSGSAGSGKSRTLDVLRLQARLAGSAWVAASCAGAGDSPGSVARVVLRQALALAGLPPTPAVEAWLAGGLLPAWLDLEPRARKLSLFGALAEAWAAAVGTLGGLYVGLDDWHLADAASEELVAHLRGAAGARHARWCFALEGGRSRRRDALRPRRLDAGRGPDPGREAARRARACRPAHRPRRRPGHHARARQRLARALGRHPGAGPGPRGLALQLARRQRGRRPLGAAVGRAAGAPEP